MAGAAIVGRPGAGDGNLSKAKIGVMHEPQLPTPGEAQRQVQAAVAASAKMQDLPAAKEQAKATVAPAMKAAARAEAKTSAGGIPGKNAVPPGEKKKSSTGVNGNGHLPGPSVTMASLPVIPAMAGAGVAPLPGVAKTGGLTAKEGRQGTKIAGTASLPGGNGVKAIAGRMATAKQMAVMTEAPASGQTSEGHAAPAPAKAGGLFPAPAVIAQKIDSKEQLAEMGLQPAAGADNASTAAEQGKASSAITLSGSAVGAAGSSKGIAAPPAHGSKSADKPVGRGEFLSSLTASGAGLTALHPGVGATPPLPQSTTGAGNSSSVAASNPYARLDEASQPVVLHASPQQMTIALHDASLGSLQVQVQSVNGQIAASLATATSAAHAQLSGHMASLSGYLHDQRVDVARVTVAPQSFSSMADHGQGGSPHESGNGSQPQQQAFTAPSSALLSEPGSAAFPASTMKPAGASRVSVSTTSSIDIHA
jgi:flagellar hook-length control protein FliK